MNAQDILDKQFHGSPHPWTPKVLKVGNITPTRAYEISTEEEKPPRGVLPIFGVTIVDYNKETDTTELNLTLTQAVHSEEEADRYIKQVTALSIDGPGLYLFNELPLYTKFRFGNDEKVYVKSSTTGAHFDGAKHKIDPHVLVFPVAYHYTVELTSRQEGAIGTPEEHLVNVFAPDPHDAYEQARREQEQSHHTHITVTRITTFCKDASCEQQHTLEPESWW